MTTSTTNTAARELLAAEYELDGADYVAQCIRRDSMLTTMEARCLRAISAALRSKAAASEGDGIRVERAEYFSPTEGGHFLRVAYRWPHNGKLLLHTQFVELRNKDQVEHLITLLTSKQAAGEAVAWGQFEDGRLVGLAFQRNEAGECTTPLYTTPPRHPADGGMAMQWPRGVLNRDKTLELLISHNEWRRGKEGPQTDPRLLGLALEATIAALQAGSP